MGVCYETHRRNSTKVVRCLFTCLLIRVITLTLLTGMLFFSYFLSEIGGYFSKFQNTFSQFFFTHSPFWYTKISRHHSILSFAIIWFEILKWRKCCDWKQIKATINLEKHLSAQYLRTIIKITRGSINHCFSHIMAFKVFNDDGVPCVLSPIIRKQ